MSMKQSDLITDLQAILKDAANKFTAAGNADFIRHLDIAAADLARKKPYKRYGEITLSAGVVAYDLPSDFIGLMSTWWGDAERDSRKPWDDDYPGPAPRTEIVVGTSGSTVMRKLMLTPAPTAAQISDLGETYPYTYKGLHVISDTDGETTVSEGDRDILLIRATAAALLELANNGITKPVELGQRGVGAMPKNGTPAALSEQLLKLFEDRVNG